MENKASIKIGDRLLEARQEGLKNKIEYSLRPHGKLWGMDVFSWYQPNVHLLANTLHSFPFPVIWIGNLSDISATMEEDPSISYQLSSVITYDSPLLALQGATMSRVENCAGLHSADDAFLLLKALKKKNAVLLFTASGVNWTDNKDKFEAFLTRLQTK